MIENLCAGGRACSCFVNCSRPSGRDNKGKIIEKKKATLKQRTSTAPDFLFCLSLFRLKAHEMSSTDTNQQPHICAKIRKCERGQKRRPLLRTFV